MPPRNSAALRPLALRLFTVRSLTPRPLALKYLASEGSKGQSPVEYLFHYSLKSSFSWYFEISLTKGY